MLHPDRPGALLAILQEFALRAVEPDQAREPAGQDRVSAATCFSSTSTAARIATYSVAAAITAIEEQGLAHVVGLGSYPAGAPD